MCVSASTMEGKKLLILASIRQPMADHSNKVTHVDTQMLCDKNLFCLILVVISHSHCGFLCVPGQEACGPGDKCNGSSWLPGVRGRGVVGSIHCSKLCLTWHISGTTWASVCVDIILIYILFINVYYCVCSLCDYGSLNGSLTSWIWNFMNLESWWIFKKENFLSSHFNNVPAYILQSWWSTKSWEKWLKKTPSMYI